MDQKIPKNSKKLLLWSALAIVALLATSAIVLFFYQKANAAETVSDSFLHIKKVRSFSVDLRFAKNVADVHIDYHSKTSNLSRISMTIRKLSPKKNGTFKSEILANTTDLYAWISYSQMKDIVKLINATYLPGIEKMKSYKLLRPILFERKSVHFDIKTLKSQNENVQQTINAAQQKELNDMLMEAMIIRTSKWRVSSSRVGPTRYAIGFKKDRLIAYIERQKALNPNMPSAQYELLKQLITSTNDLDRDLIVITIDSKGYPKEIVVYMPKAPKRIIDQNIDQQIQANRFLLPFTVSLKESANTLSNKKSKGLEEFVRVKFNHYNNAPKVRAPRRPTEFSDLLKSFQNEMSATKPAVLSPTSKAPSPTQKKIKKK